MKERDIGRTERALTEREMIILKRERKREREDRKSIGRKREDHPNKGKKEI